MSASSMAVVRAVPSFSGQPEKYFDLSGMEWRHRQEFRDELVKQGYWVQDIWLDDPIQVQVAAEMRRRVDEVPK